MAAKRLLEDQNCPDLATACRRLRIHPVKRLLLSGSNPSEAVNKPGSIEDGFTPLHIIMHFWSGPHLDNHDFRLKIRAKIVKLLLLFGADVRAKDAQGNTPLHLAAKLLKSRLGTLRLLVRFGAPMDIKNNDGETPLDVLLQFNGKKKEIDYFIKNGATPREEWTIKNKRLRRYPFSYANYVTSNRTLKRLMDFV